MGRGQEAKESKDGNEKGERSANRHRPPPAPPNGSSTPILYPSHGPGQVVGQVPEGDSCSSSFVVVC